MKYIKKLLSESTRTTERGVRTRGTTSHAQQTNATRTKANIKKKIEMARKIGPEPGQLGKGETPKPEVQVSHTVYKQMGMLMAEALGLVSEEETKEPEGKFDYMKDTPKGTAKTKKAQKDKAAAQTAANRRASADAKEARGGDDPNTTTTTPRPASEANPDTPGQRAVAKQYGRSSTA
jgi:hypothetical protein